MTTNKKIKFKIISPERIVFNEEVDAIYTEGLNGMFGILPDHIPFMTPVKICVTKVIQEDKEEFIATMGGTFQICNNEAVMLTKGAERSTEIDVLRAKNAKEEAEARLGSDTAELEAKRINERIARAMVRLKAASKQQ